jgi:hypothetical protein
MYMFIRTSLPYYARTYFHTSTFKLTNLLYHNNEMSIQYQILIIIIIAMIIFIIICVFHFKLYIIAYIAGN